VQGRESKERFIDVADAVWWRYWRWRWRIRREDMHFSKLASLFTSYKILLDEFYFRSTEIRGYIGR
jgi:hypothetical protein